MFTCKDKCLSYLLAPRFTKKKTKRCKICNYKIETVQLYCWCCGAKMTGRVKGKEREDVIRL
jgi:hypothetical protein